MERLVHEERMLAWLWRLDDWRGQQHAVGDETLLELQQLAHEVKIWRDDRSRHLHQLVSLQQRQRLVAHHIGNGNGSRSRDAGLTMQQHG